MESIMANELKLGGYTTGQTVVVRLYDSTFTQVGTDISATEPSTGNYMASVPGGTAAGTYEVVFFDGSDAIGQGRLYWDGTTEKEYDHPIDWQTVYAQSPAEIRVSVS